MKELFSAKYSVCCLEMELFPSSYVDSLSIYLFTYLPITLIECGDIEKGPVEEVGWRKVTLRQLFDLCIYTREYLS